MSFFLLRFFCWYTILFVVAFCNHPLFSQQITKNINFFRAGTDTISLDSVQIYCKSSLLGEWHAREGGANDFTFKNNSEIDDKLLFYSDSYKIEFNQRSFIKGNVDTTFVVKLSKKSKSPVGTFKKDDSDNDSAINKLIFTNTLDEKIKLFIEGKYKFIIIDSLYENRVVDCVMKTPQIWAFTLDNEFVKIDRPENGIYKLSKGKDTKKTKPKKIIHPKHPEKISIFLKVENGFNVPQIELENKLCLMNVDTTINVNSGEYQFDLPPDYIGSFNVVVRDKGNKADTLGQVKLHGSNLDTTLIYYKDVCLDFRGVHIVNNDTILICNAKGDQHKVDLTVDKFKVIKDSFFVRADTPIIYKYKPWKKMHEIPIQYEDKDTIRVKGIYPVILEVSCDTVASDMTLLTDCYVRFKANRDTIWSIKGMKFECREDSLNDYELLLLNPNQEPTGISINLCNCELIGDKLIVKFPKGPKQDVRNRTQLSFKYSINDWKLTYPELEISHLLPFLKIWFNKSWVYFKTSFCVSKFPEQVGPVHHDGRILGGGVGLEVDFRGNGFLHRLIGGLGINYFPVRNDKKYLPAYIAEKGFSDFYLQAYISTKIPDWTCLPVTFAVGIGWTTNLNKFSDALFLKFDIFWLN
ncbi:hypothetical protein KAR48_16175 [bacterium]|nr:hypothetical protein [bacterium]